MAITKYDWKEGARGQVLEPRGSRNLQHLVFVHTDGGALRELYSRGALYGVALADTEALIAKDKKERIEKC